MINEENVRGLVAALRSGQYTQGCRKLGEVHLDGSEEFCCLGVACEYALGQGLEGARHTVDHGTIRYVFSNSTSTTVLPWPAGNFYGFDNDNPHLTMPCGCTTWAVTLNDTLWWDFLQIADAFDVTYLRGEYGPGAYPPHPGDCRYDHRYSGDA